MQARIGILVIGSLFWDEHPSRQKWRSERLVIAKRKRVPAPIRYGRRSRSRGDSFTMVFSSELERNSANLGKALCIPCIKIVKGADDLVEEAECLWAAEEKRENPNGTIAARWGAIALLVNSKSVHSQYLQKIWKNRVSKENEYCIPACAENEEPMVSGQGLLRMEWPYAGDDSNEKMDAVLATTNCPTLTNSRYPSIKEIAAAWLTGKGRDHVQYFHENRRHNIETFQDRELAKLLI